MKQQQIVKDKKTGIFYRVEPSPTAGFENYWRGYRQMKLNDGSFVDAWRGGNPILLRRADCEEEGVI